MLSDKLTELVQHLMEDYAGEGIKSYSYIMSNHENQMYAVVEVPDMPRQFDIAVVLMVRVREDKILIETDIHDRPFWKQLVKAGISRESIVLVYAGENVA
jgi:hypothetical protein